MGLSFGLFGRGLGFVLHLAVAAGPFLAGRARSRPPLLLEGWRPPTGLGVGRRPELDLPPALRTDDVDSAKLIGLVRHATRSSQFRRGSLIICRLILKGPNSF